MDIGGASVLGKVALKKWICAKKSNYNILQKESGIWLKNSSLVWF